MSDPDRPAGHGPGHHDTHPAQEGPNPPILNDAAECPWHELGANTATSETERGRERIRRISLAAVASVASKAVQFVSQVVFVSVAVRYLGAEQYGLWMSIAAGLAFISTTSLGIGPGLVNALAEAEGVRDTRAATQLSSTALAYLCVVAGLLGVAYAVIHPHVDWGKLLNAPPHLHGEARRAMAVSVAVFLLQYPLSLVQTVYTAYQEVHISYFWQICGQIVATLIAVAFVFMNQSLSALIAGYSGSLFAVMLLSGLWLVLRHRTYLRPRLSELRWSAFRRLLRSGLGFLMIGVASLFSLQFAMIALARYLGPARVTPFEVTWRLTVLIAGLWSMLTVPLWGAYGDARVRGDWQWVWRSHRRLATVTVLLAFVAYGGLALVGRDVIRLWAGQDAVPSRALLVLLAAYGILNVWTSVYGALASGLDLVVRQGLFSLANAALTVLLGLLLVGRYGAEGLAAGLVLALLATSAWMLPVMTTRYRRRLGGHNDASALAANGRQSSE